MISKHTRRGFTLVELLIVIVVIGILSAMMMLSSTEAVTTAKANNIVVAMRQWKTAALAWYMDNIDRIDSDGKITEGFIYTGTGGVHNFAENVKPSEIAKYLNGNFTDDSQVNSGLGKYHVKDKANGLEFWTDHVNGGKTWLIGCQFEDNKRLIQKLAGRAKSTGLIYKGDTLPHITPITKQPTFIEYRL